MRQNRTNAVVSRLGFFFGSVFKMDLTVEILNESSAFDFAPSYNVESVEKIPTSEVPMELTYCKGGYLLLDFVTDDKVLVFQQIYESEIDPNDFQAYFGQELIDIEHKGITNEFKKQTNFLRYGDNLLKIFNRAINEHSTEWLMVSIEDGELMRLHIGVKVDKTQLSLAV